MSETNKTYRIKTKIGTTDGFINVDTNLIQDYDVLDILSVKISSSETYKLHNSNYGVVVGRVLANNGFGVPNAKISIFIEADSNDGDKVRELYPFTNTYSKNSNGVRYNLLPDDKVADCHQVVGTFPNKRYMLDNDVVLEVFDKYYKYTTRTNNAGDYLIMGVPVGTYTLHMDLDLSDCGILSQKPRDFVYKGYTIEQFENPSKFKEGKEYNELSQVFSQDQTVNVIPFWGNESTGEQIGITRADINVAFKFETTCVFIGSVISDNASNGITKKCMATENMGNMEEMTTGEGTIEMIRKTPSGEIEEFQVKGTQLIDGNGVWCYQIPMNLDYMMTDEYGNMVPTDDPEKGIPTRTSVRFRISMQDNEENTDNFFRAKVLVPHNPQFTGPNEHEEYDYEFGTYTKDESFRDLFWDNVYSVKSYIPRFQKRKVRGWRDKNFTGIKSCNFHGTNNPMPYNNIRIKLPLMFTIMCAIIKTFIKITGIFNGLICTLGNTLAYLGRKTKIIGSVFKKAYGAALNLKLNVLSEGLCPDLENWYFAPLSWGDLKQSYSPPNGYKRYNLLQQTLNHLLSEEDIYTDDKSIDAQNVESEDEVICLTTNINYLIACLEMNLAMEYRVINFDFYNDWINGTIYIPRFMRYVRPKRTFLGITFVKSKLKACMDDTKIFSKTRRYTQMCSMGYKYNNNTYTKVNNPLASNSSKRAIKKSNNFHKKNGFTQYTIFGRNGGICHEQPTSRKQYVYYMKPCEWSNKSKVNLFATDIILLGSLKDCDENGLPKAFRYLSSTSYIMPTNLALTNMESNGHLYANNKNTICAGQSNQILNDNSIDDIGVQMVSPNSGLSTELEVYANAKDNNIDTKYDGLELSDIIALTEAAGISWNYTGPGQGEIVEKNMYYPGGHFLGMSCTNSQTNIKSCVNLSRICEVGVTMSQRKEDIGEIDKENGKEVYYYTVPTGFISGNEIIGEDFRAMFATMNQNRLQATNINFETGYKYYDFDFVKPVNFNGVFHDITKKGSEAYYNTDITLPTESEDILEKHGISYQNRNNRADYDENESLHTQTRTIEDTSVDYYRFRFGLNNDNLSKNNAIHDSRFLTTKSGYKYLPQYENSYYFYFGMNAGATAIDEFNKQFFSVCEPTVLKQRIPIIDVNIDNINLCAQTGEAHVVVDNIEMPLQLIKFTFEDEEGIKETDITLFKNTDDKDIRTLYDFNISDNLNISNKRYNSETINFGKYTISIIDSNGTELNKEFNVGIDLFKYDYDIKHFNVYSTNDIVEKIETRDEYLGGYVQFNNYIIDENYRDYILDYIGFEVKANDIIENSVEDYFSNNSKGLKLYVKSANTEYSLYIKYKCINEQNLDVKKIFLEKITVKDGKSVGLNMGWVDTPFFVSVKPDSCSTVTYPTETKNDVNPYLFFGEDKWWTDKTFGNSRILGARTNQNDLHKPITHIEIRNDDIYVDGGNGGSSGGSNKPTGSIDRGYTPYSYGLDTPLPDNKIYHDTDDNYGNWIKRVSIIKSTPKTVTHSNNIFTTSGNKILWGNPQNSETVLKEIHCTEIESNYNGYTLDDDVSYHQTIDNYSAIGVDDDGVVSGDYFAKLVNGKCQSGVTNGCYGKKPVSGSGYVFKTIPDGEIVYLTYDGTINEKPRGIENDYGIYYSSFIYPVVEKPMTLRVNFFIWNEISIDLPENEDGSPEIIYNEMAGRTEMQINNGIRYKNNLGAIKPDVNISDKFYYLGLDVSNIKLENLIKATSGRTTANHINGMDVTVVDNNGVESIVEAYDGNYAKGVTGITDAYYMITEGYPYINDEIDLSNMVNKVSDSFNYGGYFGDYATYKFVKGSGIEISIEGDSKGSGNGFICLQKDGYKLLERPGNNDGYIHIKGGNSKKPDYWVLCRVIETNKRLKNNVHELPGGDYYLANNVGDLFIMYIHYYTKKKFNVRWTFKYKYIDTEDSDTDADDMYVEEEKSTTWDLKKDTGADKSDMKDARGSLDAIYNIMKNHIGGDGIYFEFLDNYRIKTEVSNQSMTYNWWDTIVAHANNYGKNRRTLTEAELEKGKSILYYVDRMPLQLSSNGMGEAGLFKIYPVLFEKYDESDFTDFTLQTIYGEVIEENNKYKTVVYNKTENGEVTVNGNKVIFSINYSINKTDNATEYNFPDASTESEAISRLMFIYNNKAYSAINYNYNKKFETEKFNLYGIGSLYTPTGETSSSFEITYGITVELKDGFKDGINENVLFYITNSGKSETLLIDIQPYKAILNVYSDPGFSDIINGGLFNFSSQEETKFIYIAYEITDINANIIQNISGNSDVFSINSESSIVTVDEKKYKLLTVQVSPKDGNLNQGDYKLNLSYYVDGKSGDTRYVVSYNFRFDFEGVAGIFAEPSIVKVYTTGPKTGDTVTIGSNQLDNIDWSGLNISSSEGFDINRTSNMLSFEYTGTTLPSDGQEFKYSVELTHNNFNYTTEFNVIAYPYVRLSIHNMNSGVPDLVVKLKSHEAMLSTFMGITIETGGNAIFRPNNIISNGENYSDFNSNFTNFTFNVSFAFDRDNLLLKRLYYFSSSNYNLIIPKESIFLNTVTNERSWDITLKSDDYKMSLDSHSIIKGLYLNMVNFGDNYKLRVSPKLTITDVDREETPTFTASLSNGNTEAIAFDKTNTYLVIDFSKLNKNVDNGVELQITINTEKEIEKVEIGVIGGNVIGTLVKDADTNMYKIPVLEICNEPVLYSDNYHIADVDLLITYKTTE